MYGGCIIRFGWKVAKAQMKAPTGRKYLMLIEFNLLPTAEEEPTLIQFKINWTFTTKKS